MSTAERRVQNEEVEIRRTYDSRITTNKVLILATSDLILFPMPNAQRRSRGPGISYSTNLFIAFLFQILRRSEPGDAFEGGIKIGAG